MRSTPTFASAGRSGTGDRWLASVAAIAAVALATTACSDDNDEPSPTSEDAVEAPVNPQLAPGDADDDDRAGSDDDGQLGDEEAQESEGDDEATEEKRTDDPNEPTAWQTTQPAVDPSEHERPSEQEVLDAADEPRDRGDYDDEELVIRAAEVMLTWDLRQDVAVTDGYRRALGFFASEFDEIFVVPENLTIPQDWWDAFEHEAVSVPGVEITDAYEVGEMTEYQVVGSWAWVGEDGWTGEGDVKYMTFQVSHDDGPLITNWTEGGFQ